VVDNSGNLLFAERGGVRKIDGQGILSTLVDGANDYVAGLGLAVDRNNNLLIADTYQNQILMVSPDGSISTIAGTGSTNT
jgi:hypothetical protein